MDLNISRILWKFHVRNNILVDSDVILKLCVYALAVWKDGGFLSNVPLTTLAASKFILKSHLLKKRNLRNSKAALEALESLTSILNFTEPTKEETEWAAEIEFVAQRNGFSFDIGESQLLSILVHRQAAMFITGDKRAIAALPLLCASKSELQSLSGKVACLEQIVLRLLAMIGGKALQSQICSEPDTDRALANCFACTSGIVDDEQFSAGLISYISHVRAQAGGMLCANDFALPSAS